MELNRGFRIIKVIDDADFSFIEDYDVTDEKVIIKRDPKHGTIIYVAGLVKENEDSLICLGAEENGTEFRVALYPPFLEFDKKWNELMQIGE